jgi:glycosyltransferase involved in cell wall biosynthesis
VDAGSTHVTGGAARAAPAGGLKLSVLMPVHNENATVSAAVADVLGMDLGHPFELVIVDDGSTDGTSQLLESIVDQRVVVYRHPVNLGKGAAVLSAASLATGSHFVIFDADREYRAADLARMLAPIADGTAEVVFGVRMFGMNTVYHSFRYALGNRATTFVANLLFDACLTDLHSCLKMMPAEVFRSLNLTRANFGLDSEITAELLRRGYRPYEVPVSYVGRSHAEGKKITWRDGFDCLRVLASVRLRPRAAGRVGPDKQPLGQVGPALGSRPPLRVVKEEQEEVILLGSEVDVREGAKAAAPVVSWAKETR